MAFHVKDRDPEYELKIVKGFIRDVSTTENCTRCPIFLAIEINLDSIRTSGIYNRVMKDRDMGDLNEHAGAFRRLYPTTITIGKELVDGMSTTEHTKRSAVETLYALFRTQRCRIQKPLICPGSARTPDGPEVLKSFLNQMTNFMKEPIHTKRKQLTTEPKYTYSAKKSCGKDDLAMAFLVAVYVIPEFYMSSATKYGLRKRMIRQPHHISSEIVEHQQRVLYSTEDLTCF